MGNKIAGRRRPVVEERYTRPQGLYPHPDIDHKKLRRLILESKLAPCYPGGDDAMPDFEECPICFLYYPSLNRSKCCTKGICTECFLQMKSPSSSCPTQCPFCKTPNYAVEYRGVKTKEEKGMEQLEEQRVIEAQIRMRQQEIQDEAERMKKKQIVVSSRTVTPEIKYSYTGGTSCAGPITAKGSKVLSSQLSWPELAQQSPSSSRQIWDDNFDLDLEEIMLMEAIWLSMQDHEGWESPVCVAGVLPQASSGQHDKSVTASSEASSSGGFACAVAALAEHQHKYSESSPAAACSTSMNDMLQRSDSSYTEDESIVESSCSGNRIESSSSGIKGGMREGGEYSIDQWSDVAQTGSSIAGSAVVVDGGAASLVGPDGSNVTAGHLPESFEEQMTLAMAVSLAEARARASSSGLTWL